MILCFLSLQPKQKQNGKKASTIACVSNSKHSGSRNDSDIGAISVERPLCLIQVKLGKIPAKSGVYFSSALVLLMWTFQFVSRLALSWASQSSKKLQNSLNNVCAQDVPT